jgi:hypothetical protein
MAGINSDDDLISEARSRTGANRVAQHPRGDLKAELDEVKEQVAREVERALDEGTIDLYQRDAVFEIAQHLFYLRVADRRRRVEATSVAGGASGGVVPAKEIPKGIGRLRRHSFESGTLGHWRDNVIRGYNRITED